MTAQMNGGPRAWGVGGVGGGLVCLQAQLQQVDPTQKPEGMGHKSTCGHRNTAQRKDVLRQPILCLH